MSMSTATTIRHAHKLDAATFQAAFLLGETKQ
jgi:hypothetical protein